MKAIRKGLLLILSVLTIVGTISVPTYAEPSTDLKDLKVYAVKQDGTKKLVKMKFKATKYSYNIKVKSNVASIEIVGTPAVNTSKVLVEKQGINTKMDFGKNLTVVDVTSATGQVRKYTINTTKLTAKQEKSKKGADNKKSKKAKKTEIIKIAKKEYTIASDFDKKYVPTGFEKTTSKYKNETYPCIKGTEKDITAFFLKGENPGFYIYNPDNEKFFKMTNVRIHSRLFTIVKPTKIDDILDNYEKKTIKIDDKPVKVWALDPDNEMYLVYAMNWDGEEALYQYDNKEKCMERYIVSADASSQAKAANEAYDELHNRYNKLVDKYNLLIKVLCILVLVIVILIFVIINMRINKKERVLKAAEAELEKYKNNSYISDVKDDNSNDEAGTEEQTDVADEIADEIADETVVADDLTQNNVDDASIEEPVQEDNNNYDEDNFFIDISGMTDDADEADDADGADDGDETENTYDTDESDVADGANEEIEDNTETAIDENMDSSDDETESENEQIAETQVLDSEKTEADNNDLADENVSSEPSQVDLTTNNGDDVAVTSETEAEQPKETAPTKAELKAYKKAQKEALKEKKAQEKAAKKAQKAALKAAKKQLSKPEEEGVMDDEDLFIDLANTTDVYVDKEQLAKEEQPAEDENISDAIKSMLPDDDDDFEFIDLE